LFVSLSDGRAEKPADDKFTVSEFSYLFLGMGGEKKQFSMGKSTNIKNGHEVGPCLS
jgi:hypothetical protein